MSFPKRSSPRALANPLSLLQPPLRAILRTRSTTTLSSIYESPLDSPSSSSSSSTPSLNHSTTTLITPLPTSATHSTATAPNPIPNFFTTLPPLTATILDIATWLQTWFTINYSFLDPSSAPAITTYLTRLSLTAAQIHTLSEAELRHLLGGNTASLGSRCVEALGRLAGDVVCAREVALREIDRGGNGNESGEGDGEVRFFLEVERSGRWGKVRGDKGWVNDEGRWGVEEKSFAERVKGKVVGVRERVGYGWGKRDGD